MIIAPRISFFFLIFVAFSCNAQEIRSEHHVIFSDPGQEFSIEFPQAPFLKTEKESFLFGDIYWNIAYLDRNKHNNFFFLIKYVDFPTDIFTSDSLDLLNDLFLHTCQDLTSRKVPMNLRIINLKGYPGREFHFLDSENNLAHTRTVYLVKNRLYFLEVQSTINDDYSNEIDHFLKSFVLTNTLENRNPEINAVQQTKKFTLKFPEKTTTTTLSHFNTLFGYLNVTNESCETEHGLFRINYTELPKEKLQETTVVEIEKFLTEAFTLNILNQGGRILSQKEIEINGRWAFEGIGSIQDDEIFMHVRSVIIDNYYYQFFVLYAKGGENNPAVEEFFNSFRIK